MILDNLRIGIHGAFECGTRDLKQLIIANGGVVKTGLKQMVKFPVSHVITTLESLHTIHKNTLRKLINDGCFIVSDKWVFDSIEQQMLLDCTTYMIPTPPVEPRKQSKSKNVTNTIRKRGRPRKSSTSAKISRTTMYPRPTEQTLSPDVIDELTRLGAMIPPATLSLQYRSNIYPIPNPIVSFVNAFSKTNHKYKSHQYAFNCVDFLFCYFNDFTHAFLTQHEDHVIIGDGDVTLVSRMYPYQDVDFSDFEVWILDDQIADGPFKISDIMKTVQIDNVECEMAKISSDLSK
jgi:hypothetical protein